MTLQAIKFTNKMCILFRQKLTIYSKRPYTPWTLQAGCSDVKVTLMFRTAVFTAEMLPKWGIEAKLNQSLFFLGDVQFRPSVWWTDISLTKVTARGGKTMEEGKRGKGVGTSFGEWQYGCIVFGKVLGLVEDDTSPRNIHVGFIFKTKIYMDDQKGSPKVSWARPGSQRQSGRGITKPKAQFSQPLYFGFCSFLVV